jgi:hypothetical protein
MTPVLLLLTMVSTSAEAQRVKLDDSLSPTETYPVNLSWAPGEIKRSLNSLIAGTEDAGLPLTGGISNVEVRLDTRDFVGADARIYLTLPALVSGLDSPAGLELSWEASDQFLSGAVHPGQSTLVFDGTIEAPVTSAIFNFLLVLDTDTSADSFELEPIYELEVLP